MLVRIAHFPWHINSPKNNLIEIEINTEIFKNRYKSLGRLRYKDKGLETLRNKETKTKTGRD